MTEEYIDVEARLANKREYLKRYKELLSKATTVNDVLAIEQNIRPLQEEIESNEARLKLLNEQIAFSIIHMVLSKSNPFSYKPEPQDSFIERIKLSVSTGWRSLIDAAVWAFSVWPYIILLLIIAFILRRVYKRRRSRKGELKL